MGGPGRLLEDFSDTFWRRLSCSFVELQSVKATGTIGVVGVFEPQDPGAPDEESKQGQITFDIGTFFSKGQPMGTGQANVKAYNRQLRDLIHVGKAKPSFIVSHNLPLTDAVDAYKHFDARDSGWTKFVLKTGR